MLHKNAQPEGITHGSLFSGLGGFDLASQALGWANLFYCDIDPFCRAVLRHYWPNARAFKDINNADFTFFKGRITVLSGGFPCQPFSLAGSQKGAEDERYKWPEMLRAIREIKPLYVVAENVPGLLSWNDGYLFESVCTDLEVEGYEVQPLLFPAAGTNAPHRRERLFIVAFLREPGDKGNGRISGAEYTGNITNSNNYSQRKQKRQNRRKPKTARTPSDKQPWRHDFIFNERWEEYPDSPIFWTSDNGVSERLDVEALSIVSEKDLKDPFNFWWNNSIKGAGNAVVPQVAHVVFSIIDKLIKNGWA